MLPISVIKSNQIKSNQIKSISTNYIASHITLNSTNYKKNKHKQKLTIKFAQVNHIQSPPPTYPHNNLRTISFFPLSFHFTNTNKQTLTRNNHYVKIQSTSKTLLLKHSSLPPSPPFQPSVVVAGSLNTIELAKVFAKTPPTHS